MNSFALVLLLAAAASAASVPSPAGSGSTRGFPLYGHPAAAAGVRGDVAASEIPSTELQGWRSVYEKPTILAVKHEDKPEVTAFLAKDGLSGLAESPETRFLHDMLRFGEEKVGVFLSASKFLPTGESDLPVSGMVFPKGFSLSDAAHAKMAAAGDFPWVLVAPKKDMRAADLSKLALVGDFKVTENGIKVASNIPAPAAAKWASRHAHFPTSAYAAVAGRRSSPNPFFAAAADEASFIPTASAGSGRFAMAYPGAPASAFAAIPAGARVALAQPGAPLEAIAAYPSGFGKSTTFVTLPAASRTFGSPAPVSAIIAEGFASPSPASAFESDDEATITLIPAGSAKYDKFGHFGHHGQYAPPCTPYFRAGSAKYDPYFNPASQAHGCAPYVLA